MEFKTETEILKEMLIDAKEKHLLTLSNSTINSIIAGELTENQYILDLSTHAKILTDFSNDLKEIYENTNINTATGAALDAYGILLNIPRLNGQPARVDIIINAPVNSQTIMIPAGTKILLTGMYEEYIYVLSEAVTIAPGVTQTPARAESQDHRAQPNLAPGAVVGVENYPQLSATNTEEGTNGKNIEEDDEYRIRLSEWVVRHEKGTYKSISEYLENYDGIDSFKIIPRHNGVGTCKIVCKTLISELETIKENLIKNCVLITDEPPEVVAPGEYVINNINFYIHFSTQNISALTVEEVKQNIINQTKTYINGGYKRNGEYYPGLQIGANFYPSELITYLQKEIPEISNIRSNVQETIIINDTDILQIESIGVTVE